MLQVSRDWLTAAEPHSGLPLTHELFGYVWLALACDAVNARSIRLPDEALAGIDAMRTFPLIVFKYATACNRRNRPIAQPAHPGATVWRNQLLPGARRVERPRATGPSRAS